MQNTRSTLMGLGVIIWLLSAEDLAFCLFMPSDEMIFLSVACVPLPVCALLKVGAFGIDFRRLCLLCEQLFEVTRLCCLFLQVCLSCV